ncbi:MAG: hypothetical protein ACRCXZ_05480 [Patescibacteria group bacterium]
MATDESSQGLSEDLDVIEDEKKIRKNWLISLGLTLTIVSILGVITFRNFSSQPAPIGYADGQTEANIQSLDQLISKARTINLPEVQAQLPKVESIKTQLIGLIQSGKSSQELESAYQSNQKSIALLQTLVRKTEIPQIQECFASQVKDVKVVEQHNKFITQFADLKVAKAKATGTEELAIQAQIEKLNSANQFPETRCEF